MGEGGVAPEYFLYRMQWWEVNRYLNGLQRRAHTAWENTRALQWWLACMFHDKKHGSPPASPADIYQFGWEKDHQEENQPAYTPEEATAFQKEMGNHQW